MRQFLQHPQQKPLDGCIVKICRLEEDGDGFFVRDSVAHFLCFAYLTVLFLSSGFFPLHVIEVVVALPKMVIVCLGSIRWQSLGMATYSC